MIVKLPFTERAQHARKLSDLIDTFRSPHVANVNLAFTVKCDDVVFCRLGMGYHGAMSRRLVNLLMRA